MKYIDQINNFWRAQTESAFTPTEIALYFYLLHICNGLGWKNPFTRANRRICADLDISENSMLKARRTLEEAGLIEYIRSGQGRRKFGSFTIVDTSVQDTTEKGLKKASKFDGFSEDKEETPPEKPQNLRLLFEKGAKKASKFEVHIIREEKNRIDLKENTLSSIKETAPPTGVACVPSDDENIDFEERENGDTPDTLVNIPGSAVEEKEKSSAKKEKAETGDLSPETDTGGIADRLNEETGRNGTKTGKAKSPARFIKPTFEEVAAYCRERGNDIDPQSWYDYYTANGWRVGRNPMKDWKAAVRTWERNGFQGGNKPAGGHDPNRGLSRGGFTDTIELDEHERKRKYTGTL